MTDEQRQARLAELRAKREASFQYKNGPVRGGYVARVASLDAEIARLEAVDG